MRILSKSIAAVVAVLACSCSSLTPWRREAPADEVNLAFTLQRNLVEFTTITIDGRPGRFILGSAAQRTVLDPVFAGNRPRHVVQLTEKETLAISPQRTALGGVADAIVGADAWHNRAISIDYHKGLVTYQKTGIKTGLMTLYRYPAEPMIDVSVDGRTIQAIVDTSSPDTLVLRGAQEARGTARVVVAGTDFGDVDVKYANVSHARIGNRLLARFLVTIDYGQRIVGLWFNPDTICASCVSSP